MHFSRPLACACAAAAALSACVLDWNALQTSLSDAGVPKDASDVEAASVPEDAGVDASHPKDSGGDAGCSASAVMINEVQVDGLLGASDEFVELYNPGSCDVSLAGWQLLYSPASGSNPQAHWTGAAADKIAAGGYVVIGGQIYPDAALGRFDNGVNGVLSKSGGGIALFGPDASTAADSVAWETVTLPHPFARPTSGPAAPLPPSKQSIARTPNGANSAKNAADFQLTTKPTPGLPN